MKLILILPIVFCFLCVSSCDTENEPIIIDLSDNDDGGGDGNTNGSGVDPGKSESACYPAFEDSELNVVTWNIEFFPMNGATTVAKVRTMIEDLDADIIAVQEIADASQFLALAASIDGWEAAYSNVRYGQEIGYLYKKEAFTSFGTLTQLFGSDRYFFPRQVVRVDVTHASGLEVTFLNLHLKCCGGTGSEEQNRREGASEDLKDYIDTNLPDKAVIVLGDFNDGITSNSNPFGNFLEDPSNYQFADLSIAQRSSSDWSYPGWPSHLDHILISNELFSKVRNVQTIKAESCVSSYSSTVSDHRAVLASFK